MYTHLKLTNMYLVCTVQELTEHCILACIVQHLFNELQGSLKVTDKIILMFLSLRLEEGKFAKSHANYPPE